MPSVGSGTGPGTLSAAGAESGDGPAVAESLPEPISAPEPAPASEPGAAAASTSAPGPAVAPASAPGSVPASESADFARPRPLHDPDPYSTPPYGEPGPWAPAPPVQHPAVAAAHGTAPTTPLPTVPAQGAPAQSAPLGPAQPTPVPGVPAQAGSAPGVPAQAGSGTGAGLPGQPAPQAAQFDPQGPYAASESGVPQQPGAPVPSGPSTGGDPHPAAPAAGVPPQGVSGEVPPEAGFADARPPADPWQRYDPWAPAQPLTAAPLQLSGAAGPGPRQGRRRGRRGAVVGAVLLALVAGGVGGVVGAYLERDGALGDVELPQAGAEPSGRAPDSVAGIAARALPGVVTLHVSGTDEQATGTGFVLDTRGHILTNNHVVAPAGKGGRITVVFNGGETARAEVVGHDSGYDLAVVEVTGVSGLKPIPLGNSDGVRVGDPVVAIGAPFDLEGTVTSGIISAKERPITAGGEADGSDVSYVDALQTDAPINPGNSGGPLLDSRARVIGINSAIQSADGGSDSGTGQAGSIGLGFAIPINQGKRVAEELINTGKVTHPVIGVTLDMDYSGDGARINTASGGSSPVTAGGPGARAGLRAGDVITEVDGRRIHSGEELIVRTRAHRPGDRLELTVERNGKERKVSLVLGSAGGD
ncbi:trypsin-like peptidase domain-containing protein [Streptomyces adustus]|uniref:trypsin-like peptidase domain-containing protein n=1 Tax=Streptomyces adustus TaxID=1609272 RepID=UPI00371EDED1